MIDFIQSLPGRTVKNWWYPEIKEVPFNSLFASYKVGVFISYGMTTYTASDVYNTNRLILPPAPSTFAPPANIETLAEGWVTSLNATGKVDYYIITTGHHIGYNLWNSQIDLETQAITDAQFGSINIPIRANYKETTYDVVGVMVAKAKTLNKPVFLYHNIGRRVNDRGSNNYGDDAIYTQYMIDKLKELITLYNPDGLWLDAPIETPWNDNDDFAELHQLYTALKNHSRKDLKISINDFSSSGTLYVAGKLRYFPSDIIALERDVGRTLTDTDEYNYPKTHDGKSYYINSEDINSNNDEIIYFGADDKGATPSGQSAIQTLYNSSKAVGVPMVLNVSPSQDGTLSQWQLDLISNINL